MRAAGWRTKMVRQLRADAKLERNRPGHVIDIVPLCHLERDEDTPSIAPGRSSIYGAATWRSRSAAEHRDASRAVDAIAQKRLGCLSIHRSGQASSPIRLGEIRTAARPPTGAALIVAGGGRGKLDPRCAGWTPTSWSPALGPRVTHTCVSRRRHLRVEIMTDRQSYDGFRDTGARLYRTWARSRKIGGR